MLILAVSMPSDSGVTSTSTVSTSSPAMIPACTAAPSATAASGSISPCGSCPMNSETLSHTAGMRVEPPTSNTRSTSAGWRLASVSAWSMQVSVRCNSSSIKSTSSTRLTSRLTCNGRSAESCAMYSSVICVYGSSDRAILASSLARSRRAHA